MQGSLRLGLTGGIGSGKSTAAAYFQACGAHLIDTDAIARQLAAPGGAAIDALRAAFGDAAISPDGGLDRAYMRALAFANDAARLQLQTILHPRISALAAEQARAATCDFPGRALVFDVPLLVESQHWRTRVNKIVVVDCDVQTQIARVQSRSQWSEAAIQAVIGQQATRVQRLGAADAVIFNQNNTLQQLHLEVQ